MSMEFHIEIGWQKCVEEKMITTFSDVIVM